MSDNDIHWEEILAKSRKASIDEGVRDAGCKGDYNRIPVRGDTPSSLRRAHWTNEHNLGDAFGYEHDVGGAGFFHLPLQAREVLSVDRRRLDRVARGDDFGRMKLSEKRHRIAKQAENGKGGKNLSQSALAEMVGVSQNTISSIGTGQFCPTAKLMLVLCVALDKKFEELFFFEQAGAATPCSRQNLPRMRKFTHEALDVTLPFCHAKQKESQAWSNL